MMVQVYVWLVVAVLLAAGVLLLAGASTQGAGADREDGGPRGPVATAREGWRDFLSGLRTLRSRISGLLRRLTKKPPAAAARATVDGAPPRVSVLPGTRTTQSTSRSTDAWSIETPQDTTIEDFFAATQTSEPAYLDAGEVSDVLHRRR